MRVLLINAPYIEIYGPIKISTGRYFPLGLGYIASFLMGAGYSIRFLDPDVEDLSYDKLAERVRDYNPQIVGITCATPNFNNAVRVAKIVKKVNSAKIVLGGVHASAMPEAILENCKDIDIVVTGEGELTMLEICKHFQQSDSKNLEDIDGIAFRQDGKPSVVLTKQRRLIDDMDSIPFPARDIVDIHRYSPHPYVNKGKKSATMITSRGCPSSCTFCASHVTMGKKFRAHSPDYVINEIETLIKNYGIRYFIINDDTFTIDKERVISICEKILLKNLAIDWYCFMRVNNVENDLVKLMKRAGCSSIGFGVESADEDILRNLKKRIVPDQCRKALEICNNLDIKTLAFFIFGSPGDTPRTINNSIRFAKELKPTLAFFNMLVPYPGTEIFKNNYNLTAYLNNLEDFVAIGPKPVVSTSSVSKEELKRFVFRANLKFYARPIQLWNILRHIKTWAELKVHLKAGYGWFLQLLSWGK